jgi:hypothetical protein
MPELKLVLMEEAREGYSKASPWPHCVIDGLWPDEFLNEMIREWPEAGDQSWRRYGNTPGRYRNHTPSTFPPSVREAISCLDSPEVKGQVEELIGVSDLFLDPNCYLLEGMHLNVPGANLGLHRDSLWNEKVQGYRVANFLLYLNPEWEDGNGGELTLWDPLTKTETACVPPLFNRSIIMSVDEDAIHGVWPIKNLARRSLAIWYYVLSPPTDKNTKSGPCYFEWLSRA